MTIAIVLGVEIKIHGNISRLMMPQDSHTASVVINILGTTTAISIAGSAVKMTAMVSTKIISESVSLLPPAFRMIEIRAQAEAIRAAAAAAMAAAAITWKNFHQLPDWNNPNRKWDNTETNG